MVFSYTRRLASFDRSGYIREPMLAVHLLYKGTPVKVTLALVDSGANSCLFDLLYAESLNIDLDTCPTDYSIGIEGTPQLVYRTTIDVLIEGLGQVELPVGFKENLPIGGILGQVGFFDQFNVHFRRADNVFEITEAKKIKCHS